MFRRPAILMYSGVVSNWKQGSPYGFVKDTDTGASYFLHKDDIIDGSRNRITSLPEGFRIEFDKAMFEGRTKAVAVTLRGGAPITSAGEARRGRDDDDDSDDHRRGSRRNDRNDDRDDYRRRDDRDDRRRDDRRDDDRRRNDDSAAYDRELSRIQGSLAVISRAEQQNASMQMKLYSALVSIAHAKGVVVPAFDDETSKAANIERWAKHKEMTAEKKEQAKERKAERRAEYLARRGAEEAEDTKAPRSEGKISRKADLDAEDMF